MGLVFRLVVLGLVPMTVIISLNCCIYWAVRRARIQRYVQYSTVQYSAAGPSGGPGYRGMQPW